jgi:hypothetical protein
VPDTGHIKSNGKEYKMSAIKAGTKAKKASSAASGSISAITTTAGKKPLSLGQYRSMTSKQRAEEKLKASQMERAGQITKAEMEAIHKKIDDANAAEVRSAAAKKSGKKFRRGDPNPLLQDFERAMAEAKKNKNSKGGLSFNKGGMSSRKGNFDMRKGGMFAK